METRNKESDIVNKFKSYDMFLYVVNYVVNYK